MHTPLTIVAWLRKVGLSTRFTILQLSVSLPASLHSREMHEVPFLIVCYFIVILELLLAVDQLIVVFYQTSI